MSYVSQYYDVQYIEPLELYFDAERNTSAAVELFFDVRNAVPLSSVDYSSLQVQVSHGALTDSYTMTVPKGTATIDDIIGGTLYGWNWDFAIASTDESRQIMSYNGRYIPNKLLYTYYTVTRVVSGDNKPQKLGISARGIISDIASQLGLTLDYHAMDWYYPLPLVDSEHGVYRIRGTYQSIISQLFGWLSELPNIDFYVTIRDGKLIVIQRGHEPSSYTVQNVLFPPSVNKRRIHTEWSGTGGADEREPDVEAEQTPFSGTIQFGDESLTYADGLLVTERHGTRVTNYQYTEILEQKYILQKETLDEDTCSKTEYEYTSISKEVYLAKEVEYTDGIVENGVPDYTDATVVTTTHVPIGNGWFGHTSIDEEGEVINTSLSQGAPGNTVTPYMVDAVQDNLNRGIASDVLNLIDILLNPPLVQTNWPAVDKQTVRFLIRTCDNLNNKIEETVTLSTVDTHIIDMSETVTYNGNTYHVESNSIIHDAETGIRQNLVLKRWY